MCICRGLGNYKLVWFPAEVISWTPTDEEAAGAEDTSAPIIVFLVKPFQTSAPLTDILQMSKTMVLIVNIRWLKNIEFPMVLAGLLEN